MTSHRGETDTEIVVHLIEMLKKRKITARPKQPSKKLALDSKALMPLPLVDSTCSETIFVAKNKSPLLIGLGQMDSMSSVVMR